MTDTNFSNIARRHSGNEFPYRCPACGLGLGIRKRVSLTTRSCPQCGTQITVREIDRQVAAIMEQEREARSGCMEHLGLIVLVLLGLLAMLIIAGGGK